MSATDIVNLNPFEKVAIDIMTLSSSESGNRYIFVPVVRLNYIFFKLWSSDFLKPSSLKLQWFVKKYNRLL